MSQYEVVFESNNMVRTLGGVEEVQGGNNYLKCYGELNGDDELVAKIPFDAVEYIVHQDAQVAATATKRRTADANPVHDVTELVTAIKE